MRRLSFLALFLFVGVVAPAHADFNPYAATLWDMIGVKEEASPEEVTVAHGALLMQFAQDHSTNHTNSIIAATQIKDILTDPVKRRVYIGFTKVFNRDGRKPGNAAQQLQYLNDYFAHNKGDWEAHAKRFPMFFQTHKPPTELPVPQFSVLPYAVGAPLAPAKSAEAVADKAEAPAPDKGEADAAPAKTDHEVAAPVPAPGQAVAETESAPAPETREEGPAPRRGSRLGRICLKTAVALASTALVVGSAAVVSDPDFDFEKVKKSTVDGVSNFWSNTMDRIGSWIPKEEAPPVSRSEAGHAAESKDGGAYNAPSMSSSPAAGSTSAPHLKTPPAKTPEDAAKRRGDRLRKQLELRRAKKKA